MMTATHLYRGNIISIMKDLIILRSLNWQRSFMNNIATSTTSMILRLTAHYIIPGGNSHFRVSIAWE